MFLPALRSLDACAAAPQCTGDTLAEISERTREVFRTAIRKAYFFHYLYFRCCWCLRAAPLFFYRRSRSYSHGHYAAVVFSLTLHRLSPFTFTYDPMAVLCPLSSLRVYCMWFVGGDTPSPLPRPPPLYVETPCCASFIMVSGLVLAASAVSLVLFTR